MAISIDKVYQTVQDLLNVEQRGYLPGRDFNNFADLAQNDLFGKMFSNLAHFEASRKGASGDIPMMIQEQIDVFVTNASITKDSGTYDLPIDTYNVKDVYYTAPNTSKTVIVEKIDHKMSQYILNSSLNAPTTTFPKYKRYNSDAKGIGVLTIYPSAIDDGVTVDYVRTPTAPIWGSRNVMGTALYDETISNDFDLHPSMFDELVDKVTYYAALSIKQSDLAGAFNTEMQTDNQIDKS